MKRTITDDEIARLRSILADEEAVERAALAIGATLKRLGAAATMEELARAALLRAAGGED